MKKNCKLHHCFVHFSYDKNYVWAEKNHFRENNQRERERERVTCFEYMNEEK